MRKILFILAALALLLGSGCATVNKMALNEKNSTLDVSERSVVIFSFRMENVHKPAFQPKPLAIYFEEPNAEKKEQRQNFLVDKNAVTTSANGNYYIVNAALPPGQQKLMGINGHFFNLLISASAMMVLESDINVPPGKVIYAGRITGEIRKRGSDSPPAGPGIPIIDQAVAGYSTGTFHITVTDAYDEDVGYLRSRYASLRNVEVKKQLLPPVDPAKARAFWKKMQGTNDFDAMNL